MMNENIIKHHNTCRMCGSKNLKLVYQLKPSPIGDAYITKSELNILQDCYPIDLYLCQDCGLAQLTDVISPDVLYGNYLYSTNTSIEMCKHFESYASEVINDITPQKNALVVDIGSNDGTLLRFFKNANLRVIGVEPASAIAQKANENGIPTISDYFNVNVAEQINKKYGKATIITANNVLANIDDLKPIVDGVKMLLADDGVFIFESFYMADVIKNKVFDFIYHEHISAFSVKPIDNFFKHMGMQLINVQRTPTKGGSLRYTIQLGNKPDKVSKSVEDFLKYEDDIGLYNPSIYSDFLKEIDVLKNKTVEFLKECKDKGKTVVGYGASVTGTTLIYHFGIGEYLDYLIDDNTEKQGRFSPGLHLPVYSSNALYQQNKPDYVLILAWRFVDSIVNKNKQYLADGGKFILPVPEFKIIS